MNSGQWWVNSTLFSKNALQYGLQDIAACGLGAGRLTCGSYVIIGDHVMNHERYNDGECSTNDSFREAGALRDVRDDAGAGEAALNGGGVGLGLAL